MTVWPYLMALAGLVTVGGFAARDRAALVIGGVMFAAYCAMRLKAAYVPDPHAHAVAALVWIGAGAFIIRQAAQDYGKSLIYTDCGLLLVVSGMCYLAARLMDAPRAFMSPPYAIADGAAIVALLIAGGSVVAWVGSGIWSMGAGRGFSR